MEVDEFFSSRGEHVCLLSFLQFFGLGSVGAPVEVTTLLTFVKEGTLVLDGVLGAGSLCFCETSVQQIEISDTFNSKHVRGGCFFRLKVWQISCGSRTLPLFKIGCE